MTIVCFLDPYLFFKQRQFCTYASLYVYTYIAGILIEGSSPVLYTSPCVAGTMHTCMYMYMHVVSRLKVSPFQTEIHVVVISAEALLASKLIMVPRILYIACFILKLFMMPQTRLRVVPFPLIRDSGCASVCVCVPYTLYVCVLQLFVV